MKKLIIIVLIVVFYSCNSNDKDPDDGIEQPIELTTTDTTIQK